MTVLGIPVIAGHPRALRFAGLTVFALLLLLLLWRRRR
jgi:hypothetical protein